MSTFLRLASSVAVALAFTACLDLESETDSPLGGGDTVCIEIYPDCPDGEVPMDLDGDGCALECGPVVCPAIAVECPDGEAPMDLDGDGCALECGPVACPAIAVECPDGEVPMDLDGDGCALECGVFCGNNP